MIFNELYAAAQTAPDAEAVRLLREALAVNAGATERAHPAGAASSSRKDSSTKRAKSSIRCSTPSPTAPRSRKCWPRSKSDAGAIRKRSSAYDRLARRTKDPRYERRLEEIKQEWSAANMPSHFRTALESPALTRAELATLLYWTVPSVRFAQNLGAPPIAVDIEEVQGRDEMIRAIALGVFDVDPVTRRVSPFRQVTADRLSALLARVLMVRGATCARGLTQDKVLAACGVTDPLNIYSADALVTGRDAQKSLDQIAKKL